MIFLCSFQFFAVGDIAAILVQFIGICEYFFRVDSKNEIAGSKIQHPLNLHTQISDCYCQIILWDDFINLYLHEIFFFKESSQKQESHETNIRHNQCAYTQLVFTPEVCRLILALPFQISSWVWLTHDSTISYAPPPFFFFENTCDNHLFRMPISGLGPRNGYELDGAH